MAKTTCILGFAKEPEEVVIELEEGEEGETQSTGIFTEEVEERTYKADVLRASKTYIQQGDQVIDNVVLGNRLSIIMDALLQTEYTMVRYAIVDGHAFRVTSYELVKPRVILMLGGVYNGPRPNQPA